MNPIVTAALVGTAQRGSPVLDAGTPVDALAGSLPPDEIERALLLRAGCAAIYTQAGALSDSPPDAPDPAPEDGVPACSRAAAHLLWQVLNSTGETRDALLLEAFERMRRAGLRLAHHVLPSALCLRTLELRAAVAPIAGERGRWLSRSNPEWSWLAEQTNQQAREDPATTDTLWQEGTTGQRVDVLRGLRATDPAEARDWLASVWRRERAEVRARLLGAFEMGLALDDEPLLESALDDRSAEVRAVAASLLARMPGSAFAARMRERADALLSLVNGTLDITPPRDPDKDADRDGMLYRLNSSKGRAVWVARALACVPLAHWEERFQASREQILAAHVASEWQEAVLEGFCRSAATFATSEWALPLWKLSFGGLPADLRLDDTPAGLLRVALAAVAPRGEVEAYARTLMSDSTVADTVSRDEVVSTLPAPWSDDFGAFFVANLRDYFAGLIAQTQTPAWKNTTIEYAAAALPPACFAAALEPFAPIEGEPTQPRQSIYQVDSFTDTIRLRQRIHKEIPA